MEITIKKAFIIGIFLILSCIMIKIYWWILIAMVWLGTGWIVWSWISGFIKDHQGFQIHVEEEKEEEKPKSKPQAKSTRKSTRKPTSKKVTKR